MCTFSSNRSCILHIEKRVPLLRDTLQRTNTCLNIKDSSLFTGLCCRQIAVHIAERAVPDAFVFAFDANLFQQLLALLGFEFLKSAVDPYASQSKCMCGIHQIAHHKASVVTRIRQTLISKNDQNNGSAVKRVEALVPTADTAPSIINYNSLVP